MHAVLAGNLLRHRNGFNAEREDREQLKKLKNWDFEGQVLARGAEKSWNVYSGFWLRSGAYCKLLALGLERLEVVMCNDTADNTGK